MIKKILCDADFFIALLIAEDSNHAKARKLALDHSDCDFIYSNLTKYELMTVLSRKLEQSFAVQAIELFEQLFTEQFDFDTVFEKEVIRLYKQSLNKNQSFFDIACLVQAKHFNYKIASFDKFYPPEILVSVL